MSARNEDFLFAQEAQNLGYISEGQVEEGFELQRRMAEDLKIDERLAVILVKRGWLAEEQARRVYGIIEPEGARTQIEGYRLVQKIGRGAMGTVYKAIHKGLHRVVAIKILRRDLAADKTQIERLRREAKLLADLDHPNIVRAFDAGESNGFPYLVMEYVEGETLRDLIARKGRLDDEEALRITRALADALEKARRMGIVHRDVKPGNILIGRGGTPKLMDLGLAKGPIDAGLTQHGATVGTPQFMSPEQAESPDKADTRSDIYSLGATLYAMVTGRPPFEGTTLAEIITKVMSQQPAPPRMRNPDVSPEVSHLIERMMLKDASLRYATPAYVIEDIDRIRGGQSIIPTGFRGNWEAYLLRKRFMRWRKRIVVGLAAALVLGLGIWWYLRDREERIATNDAGRLAREVLDDPTDLGGLDPERALAVVRAKLGAARAKHAKVREICDRARIPYPSQPEVVQRIRQLEDYEKKISRLKDLAGKVGGCKQRRDYAAASRLLVQSTSAFESLPWARRHWEALQQGVERDSDRALERRLAGLLGAADGDLQTFVEKWRAYRAAFDGPWLRDARYQALLVAATDASARAARIDALVGDVAARFGPEAVHTRVEALEFYNLREELTAGAGELARSVEAERRNWPEGPWPAGRTPALPPLLGRGGLVDAVLDRIQHRIDRAVEDTYTELQTLAESLPAEDALDRLKPFISEAERGNRYPSLLDRAKALAKRLGDQARALRQAQQVAYETSILEVLQLLRQGKARELREAVKRGVEGDRLAPDKQVRVRALVVAAEALEAVHAAALAFVEHRAAGGRATFDDIALRTPAGEFVRRKRIVVTRVDPERGVLVLRRNRGGSPDGEEVLIRDVDPATLRHWARASQMDVSDRNIALARLAELPEVADDPGVDLRERLKTFRAVLQELGDDDTSAWRQVVSERLQRLADLQQSRRDDASGLLARLDVLRPEKKPKLLIYYAELLLDPKGRPRWTPEAEKRLHDLDQRIRIAKEELARDALRRLFFGDVLPEHLPGEEKAFTLDFNDPETLRNFDHGFGVLRPAGPRGETTPRSTAGNLELHLLPGVRGFLRDRPLVLRNPFDSAKRMAIEVTLYPQNAPALLAFDLDGVQVAICSMDPNVWKRRFAPGASRLGDEDELPEWDYYGMGRGVAFHEGANFGDEFPYGNWNWVAEGQGRNFVKLRDRAYIADQHGHLFAFDPGRQSYRIRVERWGGTVKLLVDGKLILESKKTSWASRGKDSPSDPRVRGGSGRLQILTWTPVVIDDLRFIGTPTERWMEWRRRVMAEPAENKGPK